MQVADYLVKRLEHLGVDRCFMVAGGGAMHLNDALFRSNKIKTIFMHHEQSCAIAAESFFKLTNRLACICVTSGPGALNALNGIWGAQADSAGMIILAGQCRSDHIAEDINPKLRIFGDQDCPTRAVVTPLVKNFYRVLDSSKTSLSNSASLMADAQTGRPGPVWIEVPINVQAQEVLSLKDDEPIPSNNECMSDICHARHAAKVIIEALKISEKPLIIVGNGVRYSNTSKYVLSLAKVLQIPVQPVWNSIDLVPSDIECNAGRPGADGTRAGNFVQQTSDCILILGARMHVRQTGFDFKSFAPCARNIFMIDIDSNELIKPNLERVIGYSFDLGVFMPIFSDLCLTSLHNKKNEYSSFLHWARNINAKYGIETETEFSKFNNHCLNPYHLIKEIFLSSDPLSPVVTSNGSAAVISQKIAYIASGRRLITNKGCASMGYELPAAIGVYEGSSDQVLCIAGDGSIMMNLQELAIIGEYSYPIIIFLLNNNGYHSIRQTQKSYFSSGEFGCGNNSGLPFPDFKLIAHGFKLEYKRIQSLEQLHALKIKKLSRNRPYLVDCIIDESVQFTPKLKSIINSQGQLVSLPLEDMAPLLPPNEISEILPHYSREG